MKFLIILYWIGLYLASPFTLFAQETSQDSVTTGNLNVIVEGLKNDHGIIWIGLYNSSDSWNDKQEKFKSALLEVKNHEAEWLIENIPFGEYAVKLYHDENEDGQMNTNFIGMPKESYGFSNNVMGKFSPPKFEKAKFLFDSKNLSIRIKVK